MMFTKGFQHYACEGDSISCEVEGFTLYATVYRDDCSDRPDQRDCGFWPSLDPKHAGYIGPKSATTLRRHMAKAQAIMRAWENDEWWYCGVAVTVRREGVQLTSQYGNAFWGVECNYPGSANEYLLTVANELASEALEEAKAKLKELCRCEALPNPFAS